MIITVSLARMFLVVLLLLTPVVRGEAADQKASVPQEAPAPPSPPPPGIPLAEVASRATEVEALLRTYRALLASTPAISMIEKRLPGLSSFLGLELERTQSLLRQQTTLERLEVTQEAWARRQLLTTTWLDPLTRRATDLQEALTRLADQRQTWTQTQDAARAAKAPEPILAQIAGVLTAIEAAQTPLQTERAAALDLQSRIAREVARCQAALAQIGEAQRQAVGGLLERDRPAIWSAQWWVGALDFRNIRGNAIEWWWELVRNLLDPANGLTAHAGFFVVLAALLWAARRWTHRSAAAAGASFATAVFDRPFSAALLIGLLSHPLVYGVAPPEVRQLFQVMLLVHLPRGLVERVAQELGVRVELDELPLDALEVGHRPAEEHPLLGVPDARVDAELCRPERRRGLADAVLVDEELRAVQPAADLAKHRRVGNPDVLEVRLGFLLRLSCRQCCSHVSLVCRESREIQDHRLERCGLRRGALGIPTHPSRHKCRPMGHVRAADLSLER